MAANADDIRPEEPEDGVHEPNSYFKAFDTIVAELDDLAKVLTPDECDDGTPADEGARPCCNSYFSSFKTICNALSRVGNAVQERLQTTIPAERLPPNAGGIVETSGAFGTADDRTTGLWYAIFTLEGLGIAAKSVCMKSLSFVCSNSSTLPTSDSRWLEVRTGNGSVLMATSAEGAAFDTAGAVVKFTFPEAVELNAGVRYRLKFVDGTGANKAAPVMLASTAAAEGYLASFINGTAADRTDFFPCVSFTVLKPAPDITAALETAGAFALNAPEISGGSVTLADRSVNAVSFAAEPIALSFPERSDGFARSFIVRIAASANSNAQWTLPDGIAFESGEDDVLADVSAGETAIIAFMEVADNVFMVSRKTANAVAKE